MFCVSLVFFLGPGDYPGHDFNIVMTADKNMSMHNCSGAFQVSAWVIYANILLAQAGPRAKLIVSHKVLWQGVWL